MITKRDLEQLGFRIYQLKGSKQGWILALNYHKNNRIREALIIRGKTLFIIEDYEYIISIFNELHPEMYFKRLWQSKRINFAQVTLADVEKLIKSFKVNFITDSSNYLRTKFLNQAQKLIDQANCKHEFVEIGYGYGCENCHYYTGTNEELNFLIKRELERDFLKRNNAL